MKLRPALSGLLGVALCATATANNFSVSGPGGPIADCPDAPGAWNLAPTWPVLNTTVSVTNPVTSITKVRLSGLQHTYRGDIHVFLTNPAGTRFNVVVRPGWTGVGGGNTGNYLLGAYDFVESGGGSIDQGGINIAPGTYNQFLNTGGGMWTSGSYPISNTPLSGITGPAGTWTLTIVDWWTADLGSITGWTLEGTDTTGTGTMVQACFPGTGGVIGCPCGQPANPAGGCANFGSGATSGAVLNATGVPSLAADTVVLSTTNHRPAGAITNVFFTGSGSLSSGVPHGAGVRCVGTSLKRLYTGQTSGGSLSRPGMGDPTVSARSAALNVPISAGQTRHYFNLYRDNQAAGPCGNTSSTVNVTNAGSITWTL